MGWLFSHTTRASLIASRVSPVESEHFQRETLKHTLRGNVLWSVIRITAKKSTHRLAVGQSDLLICCDLLQRSGGQWGYKALCEEEWPFYYTCPLSYLAMAPVRSPGWRESVLAYHQSRRKSA